MKIEIDKTYKFIVEPEKTQGSNEIYWCKLLQTIDDKSVYLNYSVGKVEEYLYEDLFGHKSFDSLFIDEKTKIYVTGKVNRIRSAGVLYDIVLDENFKVGVQWPVKL